MENTRTWFIIAVVVLIALLFIPWGGMMYGYNTYGYRGMMGMMYSYGGNVFGPIVMVVFLIAAVLLIVWLVDQLQHPRRKR